MADDYNISYSFQIESEDSFTTTTSDASAEEELYAFAECDSLDLPRGVLLVNQYSGDKLLVMRVVSTALQYCTNFRSLRGHARFLVDLMPELGGDVDAMVTVLQQVVDAGLMISATDICQRVNSESVSEGELAASKAFIITCDRPAAVERLLESMLQNATLRSHRQLYLVDDSRSEVSARSNRELVQKFNLRSSLEMIYFGAEQQRALLQELIAAEPEQEAALRFLLDRERWHNYKSYGLARTICLLLSVGCRCLVMDDDILCSMLSSSEHGDGVAFTNGDREASFFDSVEAWQKSALLLDNDPLNAHLRCLGSGLSQALMALGEGRLRPEQLRDVSGSLFRGLQAEAPILLTQCGTFGDPGTVNNAWLVNLNSTSVERLLQSPGGLPSALTQRQCWLGQSQPTFSKRAIMSQLTGLDNSRILPPYFPVFRGEDQFFGALLDFLYPESLVLEYDWAVPHLPVEERRDNAAGDSTVPKGSMQLFASYLLDRQPCDSALPISARWDALCHLLDEVSESSSDVIRAVFGKKLARAQALSLQNIGDRLAESHGDDSLAWKNYLQRCLAETEQALSAPAHLAQIPGVPEGMNDALVADEIKSMAAEYAAALRAWPTLREVSRKVVARWD